MKKKFLALLLMLVLVLGLAACGGNSNEPEPEPTNFSALVYGFQTGTYSLEEVTEGEVFSVGTEYYDYVWKTPVLEESDFVLDQRFSYIDIADIGEIAEEVDSGRDNFSNCYYSSYDDGFFEYFYAFFDNGYILFKIIEYGVLNGFWVRHNIVGDVSYIEVQNRANGREYYIIDVGGVSISYRQTDEIILGTNFVVSEEICYNGVMIFYPYWQTLKSEYIGVYFREGCVVFEEIYVRAGEEFELHNPYGENATVEYYFWNYQPTDLEDINFAFDFGDVLTLEELYEGYSDNFNDGWYNVENWFEVGNLKYVVDCDHYSGEIYSVECSIEIDGNLYKYTSYYDNGKITYLCYDCGDDGISVEYQILLDGEGNIAKAYRAQYAVFEGNKISQELFDIYKALGFSTIDLGIREV